MRVAILTTDTTHHSYFVHGLSSAVNVVGVAIETRPGQRQLTQEAADLTLFGDPPALEGDRFERISVAGPFLADCRPDVMFCYGTGLVPASVFVIPPIGTVNCHGGKLPNYRGLDTNIWAALIGHPEDVGVTLHKMDNRLDQGPIYDFRNLQLPITLPRLLFETTELCLSMTIDLIMRMSSRVAVPMSGSLESGIVFKAAPSDLRESANRALSQ